MSLSLFDQFHNLSEVRGFCPLRMVPSPPPPTTVSSLKKKMRGDHMKKARWLHVDNLSKIKNKTKQKKVVAGCLVLLRRNASE